jgi:hypothetical protein
MLDIAIVVVVALLQVAMGYIALQIPADPSTSRLRRKKSRYKRLFVIFGALSVVAAFGAGWLGKFQGENLIKVIKETCSPVKPAPPEENVTPTVPGRPDLRGSQIRDVRFDPDTRTFTANFVFANHGSQPAFDLNAITLTALQKATTSPSEGAEELYRLLNKDSEDRTDLMQILAGRSAAVGAVSPRLNVNEVEDLKKSKLRLYFLNRLTYRGADEKHYFTVYCGYLSGDFGSLKGCGADLK